MKEKFTPSDYDKLWTRNLLNNLNIGGIWQTSTAIYRRAGEKKLVCELSIDQSFLDLADKSGQIETDIHRVKIVVESIGWEFSDQRSVLQ